MNIRNAAALMIVLALTVVTLILGQQLIIPLIFALLIWLLVRKIKSKLNQIPFIHRWFPGWITNIIMSGLIFATFTFIGRLLAVNIEILAKSYETYGTNVTVVTNDLNKLFDIDVMKLLQEYAGNFNFGKLFSSIFSSLRGMIENTIVVLLYVVFIFLEESNFPTKLRGLFPRTQQYLRVLVLIEKIEKSVANYIGLKTLVNLISAVISFIVLLIIGVDTPIFWAFLVFFLNFIPLIGLFISVLLPTAFCLVQFGSFSPCIATLISLGTVQFIVGNILEPKIMGNSLNISPLVAIIALALWGTLWGITGMFLSVPITVIMIIVFSQFSKTRPIAILLSEKGKI